MSTDIQWTNESWNPIAAFDRETGKRGWFCVHASTGCLNCYAEKTNTWRGNGHLYRVPNLEKVEIRLLDDVLLKPFHWREPRRVFPCSMTDLFFDAHSDAMLDRMFAVMALTPRHTYQVLTKRAARLRAYFTTPDRKRRIAETVMELSGRLAAAAKSHKARVSLDHFSACFAGAGPFPNVWLGVSTENQKAADDRIPDLLATPAAVRWISAEPLLDHLDLTCIELTASTRLNALTGGGGIPRLDWVVGGGESGPSARPCDIDDLGRIVYQCRAAGVACFVKQLGALPVDGSLTLGREATDAEASRIRSAWGFDHTDGLPAVLELRDSHGGDEAEWPGLFRVREFPERAP
jgi:protein gp37